MRDASDLLDAIVRGGVAGRWHAHPALLRQLFWWQTTSSAVIARWLAELVAADLVTVAPLGDAFDVVTVHGMPGRRPRRWIPTAVRLLVYARDGFACVTCSTTEGLTLDHIVPVSRGGSDDIANLQTMCQSCNSRKGARLPCPG